MHLLSSLLLLTLIPRLSHACVTDAVLRTLSAYQHSASAFCTQYLRPTIVLYEVETVTTTLTDITVRPPPKTTISTVIIIRTVAVQVDATSTTSLYPSPIKAKRGEIEARSVPTPPYLSQFAPWTISSGCSCFITPLPVPFYKISIESTVTTIVHATTTIPAALVTTYTYTTATSTATQTMSTVVVPNCAPINGCILPNSSWSNVPWNLAQDGPLWCQYYCGDIGGCLSWQAGGGPVCNIIALEGWRAWDPSPAPTGAAPSVGGPVAVATTTGAVQRCSDFWIYERGCPYISEYPAL